MKLSVVIPVYNEEKALPALLDSLRPLEGRQVACHRAEELANT